MGHSCAVSALLQCLRGQGAPQWPWRCLQPAPSWRVCSMLILIDSMIKRTTSSFSESSRKPINICNSWLLMWLLRLVFRCRTRRSAFVTGCPAKQQEMERALPLLSNVSAGKHKQGWIQINPFWRMPGREFYLMMTWLFCMPCSRGLYVDVMR